MRTLQEEDIFHARDGTLRPVAFILDEAKMESFVTRLENRLPEGPPRVAPLEGSAQACGGKRCGPHGNRWALPIPGETFHFRAPAPGAPATAPAATGSPAR